VVARQGIPVSAPSGEFFRPRIVNFMLGGCQFILGYAEFVIRFPLTTVLGWNVIIPRMRLRLLVS
jgi:hypothetical protein